MNYEAELNKAIADAPFYTTWTPMSDGLPPNGYVWMTERLSSGEIVVDLYYAHGGQWFCDETDYHTEPNYGCEFGSNFLAWLSLTKPNPYQPPTDKDDRENKDAD